jgi:Domain of unknown function (DUF2017)
MEICRHNDQIEISELDPFLAELLRQIPASASPDGVPTAEQRLFSSPTNGKEPELCAEWKQYVEPELRRLFQSATETVAADLEQLNGNEKSLANRTLRIPAKHTDAWLSALNQARLVIAVKNNFTEGELSDHFSLTHRIAPGPEFIPNKLLRFSAGIYPTRTGWLRSPGLTDYASFRVRTIAISRSLIAPEAFAGRRLSANASCNP